MKRKTLKKFLLFFVILMLGPVWDGLCNGPKQIAIRARENPFLIGVVIRQSQSSVVEEMLARLKKRKV